MAMRQVCLPVGGASCGAVLLTTKTHRWLGDGPRSRVACPPASFVGLFMLLDLHESMAYCRLHGM